MREILMLLLQKAKSKIALLLWLWSEKSVSPWLFQRKRLEKYEPKQPAFPPRKWARTFNEDDHVRLPLTFSFFLSSTFCCRWKMQTQSGSSIKICCLVLGSLFCLALVWAFGFFVGLLFFFLTWRGILIRVQCASCHFCWSLTQICLYSSK